MIKYYVLIHLKMPMFVTDGDGECPMAFESAAAAHALAAEQSACKQLGYTVIGWEEAQGGEGITEVNPRCGE